MPTDTPDKAPKKATAKSRVTNGSSVLGGVDGRTTWVRRFRDLIEVHTADLGGDEVISQAERQIIRRAAALGVELERLEMKFATAGEATPADLDLYQRASNTQRRHLESLGIERSAAEPKELSWSRLTPITPADEMLL